jgi:ribosomal protein S18 acetylase RimI-like enzyme
VGVVKTHTLKLRAADRDLFEAIKRGSKTIETRAATSTYQRVKVGDVLRFRCGSAYIEKRVARIKHFGSVSALFKSPDFKRVFPGVDTLEETERLYYTYPEYRQKIDDHGLLAFYLTDYVSIRPMQTSDAACIHALSEQHLVSWFGDQLNPVQDWLLGSNYKTAWVAEVDGRVVGFVIISDKPDRDYIKVPSMVVGPDLRHRGVGTHLLARCLTYLAESRKNRIMLTISEDNSLSREFFEHQGFQHVGTISNKYRPGKAELIYIRRLD